MSRYWEQIVVVCLAVIVFCFWFFLYPFIPVVREMSQLFLWNCDYLTERMMVPGGAAQYLGECIAQFFMNPTNGALTYAILFILAQKLSSILLRQFFPTIKNKIRFPLSLVIPALLWYVAMLPHIPLTPHPGKADKTHRPLFSDSCHVLVDRSYSCSSHPLFYPMDSPYSHVVRCLSDWKFVHNALPSGTNCQRHRLRLEWCQGDGHIRGDGVRYVDTSAAVE